MSNTREKLIEIFESAERPITVPHRMNPEQEREYVFGEMADHLIANGVTVQEWISVKDRLPKEWDRVLVCTSANTKNVACLVNRIWRVTWNLEHIEAVTHWMPLPEPPEGE